MVDDLVKAKGPRFPYYFAVAFAFVGRRPLLMIVGGVGYWCSDDFVAFAPALPHIADENL